MNVIMWFVAAGAAGWVACSLADLNAARGLVASGLIGTVGIVFGGDPTGVVFAEAGHVVTLRNSFTVLLVSVVVLACVSVARAVFRYFRGPVIARPLAEERL